MAGSSRTFWGFTEEILKQRMIASAVIALAVALIPIFGDYRLAVAAIILLGEGVAFVFLLRRFRAGKPPSRLMPLVDFSIGLAVIAIVPAAYSLAVIVFVAMSALYILWFGPRFTLLLTAVVTACLIGVGFWHNPYCWAVNVVAYGISAVASVAILWSLAASAEATRRRFDNLVGGVGAVIWEAPGTAEIDFVSVNAEKALGIYPSDITADSTFEKHIHPDDRAQWTQSRIENQAGHSTETHIRLLREDGAPRHVQERVAVTMNSDGSVMNRRGLLMDETSRWQAEASRRRYSDFIEGIPVALVILQLVDPDDPNSMIVTDLNPAARSLFAVEHLVYPLKLVDKFRIGEEWGENLANVSRDQCSLEHPFLNIPGNDGVFALRAVPLPGGSIGVSLEDVTKRARLAESFRHQATHDSLTGLPNRMRLHDRLTESLEVSAETGNPVALILVDLDQFKEVNDSLGHEYGDRLLKELAGRLGRNLRDCDTVARLGGDEFAVLMTKGADKSGALEVSERLSGLCERPFKVDQFRFQVGASVGIAIAPEHGTDAETLLRRADGAMYRAKANGNRVSVYTDGQDTHSVRRLELLGNLRGAVESPEQMVLHYQPKIDLQTNQTLGVEALVRWNHPQHGLLPPDEFIELAEVSGAIHRLTRNVTEWAVGEMRQVLHGKPIHVSVNLSPKNLYDDSVVDWVAETLETWDMPSASLCFEITESQLMDDPSQALRVLQELRSLGVMFSVDDFGTGYSSLAYLRELPIDEVKIDRSFVADLLNDDTIVRSIIDLGHNLGLHVAAEGVEDRPTFELLRHLGCDSAQGFLISRPVPPRDLRQFLSGEARESVTVG